MNRNNILNYLVEISSDNVLFWVVQLSIVVLFVIAFIGNMIAKRRAGNGGVTASVERGKESMALFYSSYIALSGLLVALCLSVEIVSTHKVFWVIFDTSIPVYICLLNPWSRNLLVGWAGDLQKIEAR